MKLFRNIGIFILLVAVLYVPFLQNDFISDDIGGIVVNGPYWTWVTAIGWPSAIHIGGLVTYAIYHFFGSVPWPYRLINILFHMGNVTLVWLFVRKHANVRVAFVAAVLFAVHPLAIESVTWISGGVVYAYPAFFFLLSLYWYRNTSHLKRTVSFLSFVVSLLITEKTMPLIFMFGLYEWMFGDIKKHWKHWIPYVLVILPFVVFNTTRVGGRLSALEETSYLPVSFFYNPFSQISLAVSSYIELFVWPKRLTFYHSAIPGSWGEWVIRITVTGIYFSGMLAGLIRKKSWGFWLAWVPIALGVTLSPIKIAWIVAERYVYLGYIGFCVISSMLFDRFMSLKNQESKVAVMCVGIFIFIALATRTIIRNNEWRSPESFNIATLRESPEDPRSWLYMGNTYGKRGAYDQAIDAYTQAIKIRPHYAEPYYYMGVVYLSIKDYETAIRYYKKALSINPNEWRSYRDLSEIAVAQGDYPQALKYIEKASNINPSDPGLQKITQTVRRAILVQ